MTQEQLTILEEAIASGATLVRYHDKTVQYRSLDEMMRIRDLIRQELGLAGKNKRIYSVFDKGVR